MKKIVLCISLMLSLAIFSEITVEDKIGSIIDSEMNSEFENIALEMSKQALLFSGIEASNLDKLMAITEPYMNNYLMQLKEELKDIYGESFTEEEIDAYYAFINSNSGQSFMKKQPLIANEIMEVSILLMQEMIQDMSKDMISNPELFEGLEGVDQLMEDKTNPLLQDNLLELENNNSCLYCDFSFHSFKDKNLDGANLSGSNLQGADFSNSSLLGVNFTSSKLTDALFKGSDLKGASFIDTILDSADFTDATIDGVIFEDAYLCNTIFSYGVESRDCELFGLP